VSLELLHCGSLTDLYENEIELIEVSFFASHLSFILSNVDSSLNNEVSDT